MTRMSRYARSALVLAVTACPGLLARQATRRLTIWSWPAKMLTVIGRRHLEAH